MPDDDPQKTQTGNFERHSESEISSDNTEAHSNSETGVFESERPGELIGNFRLVERLGAGGFGTVWLAEQSEPVRRQVALKMLNSGMNSREIVARFALGAAGTGRDGSSWYRQNLRCRHH